MLVMENWKKRSNHLRLLLFIVKIENTFKESSNLVRQGESSARIKYELGLGLSSVGKMTDRKELHEQRYKEKNVNNAYKGQ